MNSDKGLLTVIAVLLVAILAVLFVQYRDPPEDNSIAGSVNEVVEEVQDEIDDNTAN